MTATPSRPQDGSRLASLHSDFAGELAAALDEDRREQRTLLDKLGSDVITRLALAPVWTADVVETAGLATESDLQSLVTLGLAENTAGRYLIPESESLVMLAEGQRARAAEGILDHLKVVASGIDRAAAGGTTVPATLSRLAAVVGSATSVPDIPARLLALVEAALSEGDLAEAVNWIDAAGRLELSLGRVMIGARITAGRLVARKRRDDSLTMFRKDYFHRPAYELHLRQLLQPDSPHWAVHLQGEAGAGKTMLVRWLESEFASDGTDGSVARIDFDYLHPNYPGSEPGLLVLTLVAQLRFFASPDAEAHFDRVATLIADWHLRIEEAERTRPADVEQVRAERIELVQTAFGEAVSLLPGPVLIILDTTEELEKAPGGQSNVTAALDVVRRLNEVSKTVRIVLSGRRRLPLPPGALEVPVRGLSPSEARQFVASFGIDENRITAIVERVSLLSHRPAALNPFDLALLAGWARDDASFGTDAIYAADNDHYIQHRIIDRLADPELQRVLPVVAALGRFDLATLGGVTGLTGAELDHLERVIGQQEWVSSEADLFTVDPHLRVRLTTYLSRNRQMTWDESRRRAGDYLRRHCVTSPRAAVTIEHITSAIEVSDKDHIDLIAWWSQVEERARAESGFEWLRQITDRLLATHGPVPYDQPLAGAVAASRAACLEHIDPDPVNGHEAMWNRVYAVAKPGSRAAARGSARSRLIEHELPYWLERLDEQTAGSFVAGLERTVLGDHDLRGPALQLYSATNRHNLSPELVAMSALLLGMAEARHGSRPEAQRWIRLAVEHAKRMVGQQQGNEWLDWAADDVGARIRMTAAWVAWQVLGDIDDALTILEDGPPPMKAAWRWSVDTGRVQALQGLIRLAIGTGLTGASDMGVSPITSLTPAARIPLHLKIPSPLVVQALIRARLGDIDTGLGALREVSRYPSASEEYLMAERAQMRLVRRFRLRDAGEGLSSGLADSKEPADVALLLDVEAMVGDRSPLPLRWRVTPSEDPALRHAWWRTITAAQRAEAAEILDESKPTRDALTHGTAAEVHRSLDLLELDLMTDPLAVTHHAQIGAWLEAGPEDAEERLRLLIRSAALTRTETLQPPWISGQIGLNQAAEIALDEGDSLALRLPEHAIAPLQLALRWFRATGDASGALRSAAAAALAGLRVNAEERTYRLMTALAEAYTDLGATVLALPAWGDLLDAAPTVVKSAPLGWRPWVLRTAIARNAHAGIPPARWPALTVGFAFAISADGMRQLPTEIDLLAQAVAASQQEPRRPGPDREFPYGAEIRASPPSEPGPLSSVVLDIDTPESSSDTTHILRSGTALLTPYEPRGGISGKTVTVRLPYELDPAVLTALSAGWDSSTRVELLHPVRASAPAWESIINGIALGVRTRPDSSFVVPAWRRLQVAKKRPTRLGSGDWPLSIITAERHLARCWGNLPASVTVRLGERSRSDARVVHLIGSVAEGRRGVVFDPSSVKSASPYTSSEPFAASRLVEDWPDVDLVIVQGPPDYTPELTSRTREQAAYLRQLGGDFAAEGVPAVIVLPGYAEQDWIFATSLLTDALDLLHVERLSHEQLLGALERVRSALIERGGGRPTEDALAACLYSVPD
jgi:hypothetical protein